MGLSFNYPFEIGDSNGAIKSDIAQLQQDVGNLSQLETADKSSLVNALNEALDSTLNGVNRDLSNLSDLGNEKLRSLNSYANYGELLRDADGLSFVQKYAHSTFDLSKFTVVGTPTITNDGIASGFSSSNYIEINQFLNNNIIITTKVRITTNNTEQRIWTVLGSGSTANYFTLLINNSNNIQLRVPNSDNSFYNPVFTIPANNEDMYIKLEINGSIAKGYTSYDGINWNLQGTSNVFSNLASITNDIIRLGAYTNYVMQGSIDLKQFSITVDGVEVFNGNKTGIDVIKPDNYTVIGTPAISADGVASGFSSSDYLVTSISFNPENKPWVIKAECITRDLNASGYIADSIWGCDDGYSGCLIQYREGYWKLWLSSISGSWDISQATTGTYTVLRNTKYYVKLEFNGEKYIFSYSLDGVNYVEDIVVNKSTPISVTKLRIGNTEGAQPWKGSIDLNSFKIYVDGNLVYQPCLKIPYKESKTGSKIVDSIYRDRVNDMAEQFGYANYYTLSDIDFTLPQVELYGLIGQRTLRDSYRNGATYWELWSDRTLEIGGTCTSGVEYNLPKSFTSENDYILSVPYSAKTASSFTPTASGDFIAKGLGVL